MRFVLVEDCRYAFKAKVPHEQEYLIDVAGTTSSPSEDPIFQHVNTIGRFILLYYLIDHQVGKDNVLLSLEYNQPVVLEERFASSETQYMRIIEIVCKALDLINCVFAKLRDP